MDATEARLALLCLALQEMARALPPARASEVAAAIRHRIGILADGGLPPEADRALADDLEPLLRALGALEGPPAGVPHPLRLVPHPSSSARE
jgi:hypothetical protein